LITNVVELKLVLYYSPIFNKFGFFGFLKVEKQKQSKRINDQKLAIYQT